MIDHIEKQILFKLIKSADYLSSKDLAFSLDTSEKTILKYLNLLKSDLAENGASLEVKHGYGSRLQIDDQELFNNYLADIGNNGIPSSKEERKIYVLYRLLTTEDYINIYDLADELYVSTSLLRLIMKDLSDIIDKYHLKMDHSHSHGYRIIGNENDVRRCLSKECTDMDSLDDFSFSANKADLQGQISSIITKTLESYHVAVSYDAINALTLHILIAINRNETRNFIEVDNYTIVKVRTSPEFFVIQSINKQMKQQLGIELPEIELIYLTLHLNGKQRLLNHEHLQVRIDDDALVFYNRFLRNIYQSAGYDFFEDDELRISLLNHIVPFLTRVNQNNLITKSSLEGIKNEFPYAYDLAVTGLGFLAEKDIRITPEEVGYFALHLALSMEKHRSSSKSYDVAIISSEITSLYNITTFKLEKEFKGLINSIKYLNISEADQLDEESASLFDIILNMTDELFSFDNIMNVSSFLSEEELDKIRSYLKNSASEENIYEIFRKDLYMELKTPLDRNRVIDIMIDKIASVYEIPSDFKDSIMEREDIESTDFGNYIAIPHPLKSFCDEDFVVIAKLDKPILWNRQKVQLVFLCNLTTHAKTDWFMSKIAVLLGSGNACQNLIRTESYEDFISEFEKAS